MGVAAREKYQTMTVGYRFEDMRASLLRRTAAGAGEEEEDDELRLPRGIREAGREPEGWAEYEAFMSRIYSSTPEVRGYMLDALGSSLLNESRQVVIFHHNERGANGKSTKFALIKRAMGDLFIKCSSSLLGMGSSTASSPSGPNEELMSTRGKRLVLFSEPSAKMKLSSAFIKELTGGDEQSTRANYGKKQTFVLSGTVHVLCNKIPETDDMDGGMSRRLRCVPYGSTFVTEKRAVDEARHVYERREVSGRLGEWKDYMMYEMMEAAEARVRGRAEGRLEVVEPPAVVMAATRKLIEREDTVAGFMATCLSRTGRMREDSVNLREATEAYNVYCAAKRKPATVGKQDLHRELVKKMGAQSRPCGAMKNWWRGWKLVMSEDDAELCEAAPSSSASSSPETHVDECEEDEDRRRDGGGASPSSLPPR